MFGFPSSTNSPAVVSAQSPPTASASALADLRNYAEIWSKNNGAA
jgi:hypothetical protein